jgi:hypothetical protein
LGECCRASWEVDQEAGERKGRATKDSSVANEGGGENWKYGDRDTEVVLQSFWKRVSNEYVGEDARKRSGEGGSRDGGEMRALGGRGCGLNHGGYRNGSTLEGAFLDREEEWNEVGKAQPSEETAIKSKRGTEMGDTGP